MNVASTAKYVRNLFANTVTSRINTVGTVLNYVVEDANWAIRQVGKDIVEQVTAAHRIKARMTTTQRGIRNQVIHFGSRNLFLPNEWTRIHPSNRVIFTWFHGTGRLTDPAELALVEALPRASTAANIVHTACTMSRDGLLQWGVPADKIRVIPLGIDSRIFTPVNERARARLREELGLPGDRFIIGSFQKDGEGWDEGMKPKMIKGPDVFIEVISRLAPKRALFVLLTGPARGYVKQQLDKLHVPYRHLYEDDYRKMPRYYQALDLYVVASRVEGGPMALLESMASGVPLVTTRVGMVPDIIVDGENALVADVDDAAALAEKTARVMDNPALARNMVAAGLKTAGALSWSALAGRYYEELYQPLMKPERS